jgi:hypothetical protein
MTPTKKHVQLAQTIDRFVKTIDQEDGGDTELLQKSFTHTATFKQLLDTTTHEQMDALCELYPGFYRFAKLIENIARGIRDGKIKVPAVN